MASDELARSVVRSGGVARAGLGASLLLAPRRTARPWLGPDADRPATIVAMRAMGARDLAIGLGTLLTADRPDAGRAWLWAGVAADGADAVATLLAFPHLPKLGRIAALVAATSGAASGWWAVTQRR